jgi:hypothetical protein
MHPFSFNHLNETQFEEFCYDLLGELGFINRNWRKGTGLSTSPSDRGRDIECHREITDPLGNKHLERWFVEAKHYQKGVPPEKLQGILTWANAERPDQVLIIASNFLSNPAKDYLESYINKNNPPFRIDFWERPGLEKAIAGKSRLLRKYDIAGDFPFLSILHPVHLMYLKRSSLNTLGYFFEVLDRLDPKKRDHLLGWVYGPIIKPRSRKPITGKETLKELQIDEVSYEVFKEKCYDIASVFDPILLVFALVNFILQHHFVISDLTEIDSLVERHNSSIAYFQNLIKELDAENEEDKQNLRFHLQLAKEHDERRGYSLPEKNLREGFEDMVKLFTESRDTAEGRTKENYSLYEYFCETVLSELLEQDIGLKHG